jgi:hypothetical protein
MSRNYSVDARGVRANLQRMYKTLPENAERAMDKALNAGVRKAKSLAPVKTGKLKKSIKKGRLVRGTGRISGTFTAYAENKSGKDYSQYQEGGFTDRAGNWHEGKRFMLAGRKRAEEVLLEESKKQIRRMTKG